MLLAVGADPGRCGYTPAQVEACLAALQKKAVATEAETAQHTLWLLQQRGLGPPAGSSGARARAHPEVVKLRFDPERSPMDDIPVDLRAPLYGLMLQYAEGAVRKSGRLWLDFDPLSDAELTAPYPFEAKLPARTAMVRPAERPRGQRTPLIPVTLTEAAPLVTPVPGAGTASAEGPAVPAVAPAGSGAPATAPSTGQAAAAASPAPSAPAARPSGARPWMLGELTWPEAQKRFREVDIALLPVGSIEQHGPHLPLDVDAYDAEYLSQAVGAACREPQPLVLPLIPYGVAYHHDDFPGTLSVGPDTLSRMVYEVGMSVAKHGITKLVIINGHGGNRPSLRFAAQMINRDAKIFTCVETGETSDADLAEMIDTENDVHAGELETSTTLAQRPHLVPMDKARKFVPKFSSGYLDFTSKRSVEWFARTSAISKTGVLGDPTKATREKGERMWEVMIRNMVEFVEALKGMSLDEIYQRRY
jgi:creatinine amidohydrolase/Fe(II)-dependent formamide hydrolase-like protein